MLTWLPPPGPGIRLDTHCFQGYAPQRALDELTIVGVTTNIGAHKKILGSDLFRAGQVTTHLIDTVGVDTLAG